VILSGCGGSRGGAVVVAEMHRSWDDLIELLQPTGYCVRAGRACWTGVLRPWGTVRSMAIEAQPDSRCRRCRAAADSGQRGAGSTMLLLAVEHIG
jgi:hypothetical protein